VNVRDLHLRAGCLWEGCDR